MEDVDKINIAEIVLSTTIEDLTNFLKSFEKDDHDLKCSCCKGSRWEINSNPNDKSKPVIVTMPLPLINGSGVWAFYVVCYTCGEIKLFHTSKVATWLHEKRQ